MVPSSTSPLSSPAASSPHPLPQPAAARISILEFPPRLEVVVEDPVARARVPAVMAAVVVAGLLASAGGVVAAGRPGTISIPTGLAPSLARGLLRPPTDAVVVAAVRPRMIRDPRPRLGEGAIDETATMTMMSDVAAVAMTVIEVTADLVAVVVDIVSISELQTSAARSVSIRRGRAAIATIRRGFTVVHSQTDIERKLKGRETALVRDSRRCYYPEACVRGERQTHPVSGCHFPRGLP